MALFASKATATTNEPNPLLIDTRHYRTYHRNLALSWADVRKVFKQAVSDGMYTGDDATQAQLDQANKVLDRLVNLEEK